jgi:ankyrin repeat protein
MARVLLSKHGFSKSSQSANGWKPVHNAAWAGATDVFELLADDVNLQERVGGVNCLDLAAQQGHASIITSILRRPGGRALLEANENGTTALHRAAYNLRPECIGALRGHVDPNAIDSQQNRPITFALTTEEGDAHEVADALRALLDHPGIDVNSPSRPEGKCPFSLASKHTAAQRLLLAHPTFALAADHHAGLQAAIRWGMWPAVLRFLQQHDFPKDVDEKGNNLLHHLARARLSDPVEKVLRHASTATELFSQVNDQGNTPAGVAIQARNESMVRRLLEVETAAPKSMFDGALIDLLRKDAKPDLIDLAIEKQPEWYEGKDSMGRNLLHCICAHGQARWLDRLGQHTQKIVKLWPQRDHSGKRPVDYCNAVLLKYAPKGMRPAAQPDPASWDSGLEWRALSRSRMSSLLKQAGDEKLRDISRPRIEETTLPCYPGAGLVRVTCPAWPPHRAFYYLRHRRLLLPLTGTSPPIHEMNAKLPIKLDRENALTYLRFFCFFVRGAEGPFLILESPLQWELPAQIGAEDQAKIVAAAHPSWLIRENSDGYTVAATTFYSNALFATEYNILKTGMVEMLGDFPVAANLAFRIDRPLT